MKSSSAVSDWNPLVSHCRYTVHRILPFRTSIERRDAWGVYTQWLSLLKFSLTYCCVFVSHLEIGQFFVIDFSPSSLNARNLRRFYSEKFFFFNFGCKERKYVSVIVLSWPELNQEK